MISMLSGQFSVLSAFFRVKLSLAVSVTALAGYFSARHSFTVSALAAFVGTFLLAAGASGLNQVQERLEDARMQRTRLRPLPLRVLNGTQAVLLSASVAILGFVLLAMLAGGAAAVLGLFTCAWYNGVYTPLKRRTGYAFLIGALCGALPPVIGILAAKQQTPVYEMALIALFMYLWQIPHFIQILHKHLPEYTAAGLPTPSFMAEDGRAEGVSRIAFLLTILVTLVFIVFGVVRAGLPAVMLLVVNVAVTIYFFVLLKLSGRGFFSTAAFRGMLVYQMLIYLTLVV